MHSHQMLCILRVTVCIVLNTSHIHVYIQIQCTNSTMYYVRCNMYYVIWSVYYILLFSWCRRVGVRSSLSKLSAT
jgi:hypothetical protein